MNSQIVYDRDTVLPFGKHIGLTIDQMILENPTYFYWMYDNKFKFTKAAIRRSNEHTAERKEEKYKNMSSTASSSGGTVKHYSSVMADDQGNIVDGFTVFKKDFIRETNNRMFEKHGDLLDPDDISMGDLADMI